MNNKVKKIASAITCVCLATGMLMACGRDKGTDGSIGDDGIYRPGGDEAQVEFWINGDNHEIEVFDSLVKSFNSKWNGKIKVEMVQRTGDGYSDALGQSLAAGNAPDVFYVGDSGYKNYAELGYLYDITDFVDKSPTYKVEEMWDNVVTRYKYDTKTFLSGTESGRYYGVPKDIGPTVVYYNETYFEKAGIKILSVAPADLDNFNKGGVKDDRGNTKEDLGLGGVTVKEKGYFVVNNQKYFNNQVPMSWEETVECSRIVQNHMQTKENKKDGFGFFTEWWFNYGWSVGGNCIQQIPSDLYDCGYYYDFTLMDNTKNYIVADDVEGIEVNKKLYKSGEIIAYQDKIDMSVYAGKKAADGKNIYQNADNYKITDEVKDLHSAGKLNELPSQREAFTEFVRYGDIHEDGKKTNPLAEVDTGKRAYGISPLPTDIDGDAGKINEFVYGNLGMLVDGRWNVTAFRRDITKFVWDVAPLPMYKEYYEAGDTIPAGKEIGDIKVHGIEAGHSGSVALCISKTSTLPAAAWTFIEYVASAEGQTKQAEAGFAIPLQKDIANSDVFLQKDKSPKNSKVFIRATEYEQAGDWWFLQDNKWIDDWANKLNGSVRNATMTLTEFFRCDEYSGTFEKLDKYTNR